MRLHKLKEIDAFLDVVNQCVGRVYLTSTEGDKYNLRSTLTQFIAVAALIGERGEELELFCEEREDEARFMKFFDEYPETL